MKIVERDEGEMRGVKRDARVERDMRERRER